jgi:hypothetical protein
MRQAHSHTAERKQMQGVHQSQGINVQGWTEPGLRTLICWWGHWCRFFDEDRHHKLLSVTRERTSVMISLPHLVNIRKYPLKRTQSGLAELQNALSCQSEYAMMKPYSC